MSSSFRCVFCKKFLSRDPRQAPCGDRVCVACLSGRQAGGEVEEACPVCKESIIFSECFIDRAVEIELANTTVKCSNADCPWTGLCINAEEHSTKCKFAQEPCSNGCGELLKRSEIKSHLKNCPFSPKPCGYCKEKVPAQQLEAHLDVDCKEKPVDCPNKCGIHLTRGELQRHVTVCPLRITECGSYGCHFKGTSQQLNEHAAREVALHVRFLSEATTKLVNECTGTSATPLKFHEDTHNVTKIDKLKKELLGKLQPIKDAIIKLEPVVQQLQEGYNDMALMVQTLQATSYNGIFIWKVPEIQRRRNEAVTGKTTSLYSAPFYTSRHGYKLCLRLYMDGDGDGKGTHLSFFLTIMKGEFDALLQWPFKQTVTLTLLDQDKTKNIVQSFRPEPTSSSFQRPQSEMNVASGCPLFAPLTVLNNSSYVKQDTMFLECQIDCSTLP